MELRTVHTTVQARLVGQRLQTQEELGFMQAQGKTLPAHILLGALSSLKAHAHTSASFPALQPQFSLTDASSLPHNAPALQEEPFLLPDQGLGTSCSLGLLPQIPL